MKPFAIVRVPALLSPEKEWVRRESLGARLDLAGDAETIDEAAAKVAELQRRDERHHYYALELRLIGLPGRAVPLTVAAAAPGPKIAVDNSKEKRA